MPDPIPLYYTFGNHMHWVDMEWLWGYHVLPGSVRDMVRLCREAGVKGCVNFDGIGYEKLASEDPEAFAELREAVSSGMVEVVGGSYGQPYGLFHGGESNVRQRIFGARTVRRLFGVPVKTFWEEEFDFFPQLPQILRGVGIEYASLFFQWTWHTPEVPKEDVPVVWWEGQDGSRLLCATRNKLNLHQWPEDMELTFASLSDGGERSQRLDAPPSPPPLVLQWLELMPSPDWMCRSELILPKLRELMGDPRFEVRPVTLGGYLGGLESQVTQVRRYTMDQVWHGMTLGKNGDNMRRLSREAEVSLLTAETLAAVAGLFGRPYAQWDVYPTWELEEAWRELLSAQHHDNDECEGLCGYVGRFSYERSKRLSSHIQHRTTEQLLRRIDTASETVLFNPLGWDRTSCYGQRVPAFGYAAGGWDRGCFDLRGSDARFQRGSFHASLDGQTGILQVSLDGWATPVAVNLCDLKATVAGIEVDYGAAKKTLSEGENGELWLAFELGPGIAFRWTIDIARDADAVDVSLVQYPTIMPDPGLNASLQWHIALQPGFQIRTDSPYGVHETIAANKNLKKYPTGDWMTSEQWFETVENSFTASTLVDLCLGDRKLLIMHDGSQQWFRHHGGISCVLSAKDPWDEDYYAPDYLEANFRLCPHSGNSLSTNWKMAQEFLRPVQRNSSTATHEKLMLGSSVPPHDLPQTFSAASCDAPNVALTAFYRETRDCAKGQASHAADVLGVDYPYVLRMVELDGIETEATLTFASTIAGAVRTNLLGEPSANLKVSAASIKMPLRPYEIATVYLDLVEGRKQVRDLDAKREIWATVHRVPQS